MTPVTFDWPSTSKLLVRIRYWMCWPVRDLTPVASKQGENRRHACLYRSGLPRWINCKQRELGQIGKVQICADNGWYPATAITDDLSCAYPSTRPIRLGTTRSRPTCMWKGTPRESMEP